MKRNKASKTAQYMAFFRALETAKPEGTRIFSDPYAIHFLDGDLRLATKFSAFAFFRSLLQRYIGKKIPGAFSSGVARTRYIDDLVERSIRNGSRQLIILGAGFDTRALRLASLKYMPVIEIDHPNTSRHKLSTLENLRTELPENVTYCEIDFNTQSLEDLASRYSINFNLPATIIWEGVTNYLTPEAVARTFSWIGRFAPGSHVIFTYVDQQILDHPDNFFGGKKLLDGLRQIEEYWTFGLDPKQTAAYLESFGFRLSEDKGASEYREIYLPDHQEKGYEFYRVALALKPE